MIPKDLFDFNFRIMSSKCDIFEKTSCTVITNTTVLSASVVSFVQSVTRMARLAKITIFTVADTVKFHRLTEFALTQRTFYNRVRHMVVA